MKRVTFEIAKSIKEAGYPQDYDTAFYSEGGSIHINTTSEYRLYMKENKLGYDAPTYLDTWLWLWREKKIFIELSKTTSIKKISHFIPFADLGKNTFFLDKEENDTDPEEAIIAAINYLVEKDLIK